MTNETVTRNQAAVMRNYTLLDVCARRISKCAIEGGGLLRAASFQEKMLAGEVCYERNDPKLMYLDYAIMDGASMKYLFSEERNETCDKVQCCVKGSRFARMRFDLRSENASQVSRSLKFINAFVDFFQNIEHNDPGRYNLFDLSYYTSHTMMAEIEKHSLGDLVYVGGSFLSFWLVYFLFLVVDLDKIRRRWRRRRRDKLGRAANNSFWIRSTVYLVFVTFFQFAFTGVATLGFLSLCRVKINTMLYTIAFVLMSE